MSCYDLCPPTRCGPTPLANSCNEPCVRQCQDSTYIIQPSPVVVTLPGPILSSFPQNTTVGSSSSFGLGGYGSYGSSLGYGGSSGYGASFGLGGYGGSRGSGSSFGLGGCGSSLGFGGSSGFGGSRSYGNSFGLGGCGGYGGSLGYGRSLGYGGNVGYGGSLGYGSSGFGNCRRSYSSGFSSYGTGYYLPGAQRWGRSRRGSCGSF
ncbi:scale keratin-like [Rissa tridactyla]|uniref:scale keratin-like n=1 Tax=Rissa tridactyla TaxID=75485 RepID=UPI0023BADD95|nr:scale keratin-like [Rissa tridactyla]